MPEKSVRYFVRILFALAIAIALHVPLLLPPEKSAGGKLVKIAAAVELKEDMKDLGKALAALEQKAAEEAPAPPPEQKTETSAKDGAKDAAKPADAKPPEPAPQATPLPLTTPKMLASTLPRREDAAPPPPPGSGVPDVKPPEHTTYKEAEREKGDRYADHGPAGGDPKPAPQATPEPVRAPEPPPPAPAPKPPEPQPKPVETPRPAPPQQPQPVPAKPTPPAPQPMPAPQPPAPDPKPAPQPDPQPSAVARAQPAQAPAQPSDVAYAQPRPSTSRPSTTESAPPRRAAPASPAASSSVAAGGDSSAPAYASPLRPSQPDSSGAQPSSQTRAPSGVSGPGAGKGGGGIMGDAGDKGLEVPTLHFEPWTSKDEMISICAYFGMQLIAYPETCDYLMAIQLATDKYDLVSGRALAAYSQSFSNRMYTLTDDIADEVRAKVSHELKGMNQPFVRLTVGLLVPERTASFLAWKELAVARRAGCAQGTVESVLAKFVRTDGGKWILVVDEVRLKDGRRIPCGDVENAVPN